MITKEYLLTPTCNCKLKVISMEYYEEDPASSRIMIAENEFEALSMWAMVLAVEGDLTPAEDGSGNYYVTSKYYSGLYGLADDAHIIDVRIEEYVSEYNKQLNKNKSIDWESLLDDSAI